jgi:hypothetical protein
MGKAGGDSLLPLPATLALPLTLVIAMCNHPQLPRAEGSFRARRILINRIRLLQAVKNASIFGIELSPPLEHSKLTSPSARGVVYVLNFVCDPQAFLVYLLRSVVGLR